MARRHDDELGELDGLMRAHSRAVLRYALRRTADEQLAKEAVADTFAIAWRRWERRPEPERQLPWLYGIARRVLANDFRAERRHRNLRDRIARQPLPAPPEDVEARAADVLEALGTLDEPEREILRLAYWEGLTHAELGVALGCTVNAAGLRLARARRALAQRLDVDDTPRTPPKEQVR